MLNTFTAFMGIITVFIVSIMAVIITVQVQAAQQWRRSLVARRLRFPGDLDNSAVEAFLGALVGARAPRWRRWIFTPVMCFELHADRNGFDFLIITASGLAAMVDSALRAHLPGVRVEAVPLPARRYRSAVEYQLTTDERSLRTDVPLAAQLLTSIADVHGSDQIGMQWTAAAAPPQSVPRSAPTGSPRRWWSSLLWPTRHGSRDVAAHREKQRHPVLLATGRIGADAPSAARRRWLIRRAEASLYLVGAPGVHLHRRQLPEWLTARRMRDRITPRSEWPAILNTAELATVLGWPVEVGHLEGLALADCPSRPISTGVPDHGTVIGQGLSGGRARTAALDLDARVRHVAIVGPTGTGKSTLLLNMIMSDIEAGCGVLVIDPKQDLVDDVLARLPRNRHADVVVLDPADAVRPVGINPLGGGGEAGELAAEHLVGILRRIFSSSWGIRSEDIWRAALRTLAQDATGTLVDVGPLLTDPTFRSEHLGQVTDPVLLQFWSWYEAMSAAETAQVISPVLNKYRQIMGRPSLRRVFGQAAPAFDLAAQLNGTKPAIVLVPLSSGRLGEEAANLFGSIVLGMTWNTIQARAAIPAGDRKPLMLHLDEFARYANLPIPLEQMLAQARGYRVGVTLALQSLDQVPRDLRQTVLTQPRSRVAFQLGSDDARVLAREFGAGLEPKHLQGLGRFEVVAQLHGDGRTQRPCTLDTIAAPAALHDAEHVRALSSARWGADGGVVDAAVHERLNGRDAASTQPVGRKRRTP